MPATIVTVHSRVQEGNDAFLTNRIIMADDTPLMQADLATGATIELRVYDITSGGEGRTPNTAVFTKTDISATTGGPGGGAAISDTYATTYWGGKDSTGYNFVYQLQWDSTGATGPYLRGGHRYLCEFAVDCGTTFGVMRWRHILTVDEGKAV